MFLRGFGNLLGDNVDEVVLNREDQFHPSAGEEILDSLSAQGQTPEVFPAASGRAGKASFLIDIYLISSYSTIILFGQGDFVSKYLLDYGITYTPCFRTVSHHLL